MALFAGRSARARSPKGSPRLTTIGRWARSHGSSSSPFRSQTTGEVYAFALGATSSTAGISSSTAFAGLAKDSTMAPLSEVIRRECPVRRVGAIGGPLVAADLAAGRPSVMVVGIGLSRGAPRGVGRVRDAYASPLRDR